MKNKRLFPIILSTIIISFNMIGCEKSNTTNNAETPFYSLNIDGEKQFFDEDNEKVKDVSSFITEYLNAYVNIDYTDDCTKFFSLYTDDIIAIDSESGYHDSYNEGVKRSEIIEKLNSFKINEIKLFNVNGIPHADVTLDYFSTVSHGTDRYLELNEIELNKEYQTNMILRLLKQDNGWRLNEIWDEKRVR